MKFWKWFINLYVSKIKGIRFTPNWGLWSYYIGCMGAFFTGIIGFTMFFVNVEYGLILTGITAVFFVLAHYGWYCLKIQSSTSKAKRDEP